MNNRDRAADVIRAHGFDPCREPECIAQDLANAGLLAPDLPTLRADHDSIEAPVLYSLIGHDDDCVRYDGDSVLVGTWHGEVEFSLGKYDEVSAYMSIEQARDFAHALLAAANYSQEGNRE